MNEIEIKNRVRAILSRVAPDTAAIELDPDVNIRDQIDFDSMDLLRLVVEMEKAWGISISPLDYPKVTTLKAAAHYISLKVQPAA